jgi:hypothetical protein
LSEFGITAVSYNRAHTQIARCMLHTIEHIDGKLVISDGLEVPHTEVASLIAQGMQVWVMTTVFDGTVQPDGLIVVYGQRENLFSAEGHAIFGLPEYSPYP